MKTIRLSGFALFTILAFPLLLKAQQPSAMAGAVVPRLVSFSGRALDVQGKPVSGIAGVTFTIYKEQYEGAALWMETQNVQVDGKGNYSIQLGATKPDGLPVELFASGEARWLGVRVNGGEEQVRVMLLSVPYALKAGDAATIGGLPPSAFVLSSPIGARPADASGIAVAEMALTPNNPTVTGVGTAAAIPLWDSASDLTSSAIVQTGSGSTARIGIGVTPSTTFDVKGTSNFRGSATMPSAGLATSAGGKNSYPFVFATSAYNSGTKASVLENFRWQAEPVGNNSANPSGTLNLLFSSGTATPVETGLKVNNKGVLTFAAGQNFPGTGAGTVTSVGLTAPSSDFTVSGSPVTAAGTMAIQWTIAPTAANIPNAIVKRDAYGRILAGLVWSMGGDVEDPAVTGMNPADSGVGVAGYDNTNSGTGVYASGGRYGLTAVSDGLAGVNAFGGQYGVYAVTNDPNATAAVFGYGNGSTGLYGLGATGIYGLSHFGGGSGVDAINDAGGDGIFASGTSTGYAGFFYGNVDVDGNLSKAGGSFKIDHPLDPANKYLYHSFVESPDMMNIYNGNVTLDGNGEAFVPLPEWFEKLNRDFRYQLTCLDGFAPIYVAQRVQGNRFKIAGGKPGMEVSWQVTGVRQDEWANAHRIPVEQMKPEKERGSYLHPELYGAPEEKSIAWARHPETMKRAKERSPVPAHPRINLVSPIR